MRKGNLKITILKYLWLVFFLLFTLENSPAQNIGNGGYGGAYLRVGLGAKAKALGSASVASIGDGMGVYYNPAGLSFMNDMQISLSYSMMSLDRKFNYIGFARHLEPTAGFSLGWINSGVDNIQGYDFDGEKTGILEDSQNTFFFSFANRFASNFSIGLNIKGLFHSLPEVDTKGFGLDLGAMFLVNDNISIGVAIQDIRSKYTWNTDGLYEPFGSSTTVKFPTLYKGGIRFQNKSLLILWDVERSSREESKTHFGIEWNTQKRLLLRGGLDHLNPTFGLGIEFTLFEKITYMDYSFNDSIIDEGMSHIVSWVFHFDKKEGI